MTKRILIAAAILAALTFFAEAGGLKIRILANGTNGLSAQRGDDAERRAPYVEIQADKSSFEQLWKREIPGEPAKVDFTKETAVFLLLGAQPTGGYAIDPQSAELEAGVLRVRARFEQPMSEAIEVITAPYAVIAVPVRGVKKVEWIDADGRLLATKIVGE